MLSPEVTHEVVVENLRAQGFVRVSVDGAITHLDDLLTAAVDVTLAKELLVVVDRLVVGDEARGRLADAVGTAFREGDGDCVILLSETRFDDAHAAAVGPASIHRALRVPERRHARAGADAAAVLVQQPARRVSSAATDSARRSSTTRR